MEIVDSFIIPIPTGDLQINVTKEELCGENEVHFAIDKHSLNHAIQAYVILNEHYYDNELFILALTEIKSTKRILLEPLNVVIRLNPSEIYKVNSKGSHILDFTTFTYDAE